MLNGYATAGNIRFLQMLNLYNNHLTFCKNFLRRCSLFDIVHSKQLCAYLPQKNAEISANAQSFRVPGPFQDFISDNVYLIDKKFF